MEIIAKPAFLGVVQVYIANGLGMLAIILGYDVIVYGAIVTLAAFVPLVASFALRPAVRAPPGPLRPRRSCGTCCAPASR